MVSACASPETSGEPLGKTEQAVVGASASGSVPTGLPARFMIGLFDTDRQWMRDSMVKWDVSYQYFTKGWIDNYGFGMADGLYASGALYDSHDAGFLPAIQYYQIVGEPGGGESQMLSKLQNVNTMKSYYSDFKVLMQRVKEYGAPALILLEADGYGFAQLQSGSKTGASAAVASTGLPELAGLPNTVAGWGLSYLAIKKAMGATNAILGVHVSAWATGGDLASADSLSDSDLSNAVNAGYGFLGPLGLSANSTGLTYDVLVGDPCDRDADYYAIVRRDGGRWWNSSDTAAADSRSFNRYARWLQLWNQKSGKRWVLWQVPEGNSNSLNVNNGGAPRQGYKDNRPEYFLGDTGAHIAKFANSGVIGLLFGGGDGVQSSHVNDIYTDGKPYIKTHAKPLIDGPNLTGLATGAGWTANTTAPAPRPPGIPLPPIQVNDNYPHQYEFETPFHAWNVQGDAIITKIAQTTDKAYQGTGSLAVIFNGTAGNAHVFIGGPKAPAEATIDYHVWLPKNTQITGVQAYAEGSDVDFTWTVDSRKIIKTEEWRTFALKLPPTVTLPLRRMGFDFTVTAGFTGTVYIDTVGWPDATHCRFGRRWRCDWCGRPPVRCGRRECRNRHRHGMGPGTTGAGGADTTGGVDPGVIDETDETTTTASGCKCSMPRRNEAGRAAGLALAAVALGIARSRRRRSSSAA